MGKKCLLRCWRSNSWKRRNSAEGKTDKRQRNPPHLRKRHHLYIPPLTIFARAALRYATTSLAIGSAANGANNDDGQQPLNKSRESKGYRWRGKVGKGGKRTAASAFIARPKRWQMWSKVAQKEKRRKGKPC